jgi:hypothetical protein
MPALAVTASGRGAVTASDSGVPGGRPAPAHAGGAHRAGDVAVTELMRVGVSASEDCTLRVWSVETARHARTLYL